MRLARTTGWLAMVMAVAFVVGDVWGALRAEAPIPLAPAAIRLLPSIVAVAAGAVLVGGPERWQRTAAAYLAVVGAHVAAVLPGSISFAWADAGDGFLWWRVATGLVALGVGVVAVMVLRARPAGPSSARRPSRPLQVPGAVGGVVLAVSGVSPGRRPPGRRRPASPSSSSGAVWRCSAWRRSSGCWSCWWQPGPRT